jgi:hypothetical protein
VARAIAADPIQAGQLAIDGHDLVRELGLPPGPEIGRLLATLLEAVLDDPGLNRREALLDLAARTHRAGGGAPRHREDEPPPTAAG